jgi:Family of unknown function (DUF5670)
MKKLAVFVCLLENKQGGIMLWTIFVIILVLWLLGFSLHIAGGLIHLLLVVALIVLVINLISGRRAV